MSDEQAITPIPKKPVQRGKRPRKAADRRRIPANEGVMIEDALTKMGIKKGRGAYPTDTDVLRGLVRTWKIDYSLALLVLQRAKEQIAARVTALSSTMGQNVIAELQENIQEARRVGDLATAGRCLIALGRFAGLDQPQVTADQQVKQLSDAALEAALKASLANKLEGMSEDEFEELRRRREEKRLAGAKWVAPDAPLLGAPRGHAEVLDAAGEERAGV